MADESPAANEAVLGAIARHALHDEELVVAFASGDLDDDGEVARARSFVERCQTCRELHRDVGDIRAAIRATGTTAEGAASIRAPRDFRLSAEDAARLRPGTPVARLATRLGLRARLGLGVMAFGRPVGAALATFGIVGLLVGSLTLNGAAGFGMTAGSAAASSAPGVEQNIPGVQATDDRAEYVPLDTGKEGSESFARDALRSGQWSVLLLAGSAALLVLGVALVLAARRNLAPGRDR